MPKWLLRTMPFFDYGKYPVLGTIGGTPEFRIDIAAGVMIETILIAARLFSAATIQVFAVNPFIGDICCSPCPGVISTNKVAEFTCNIYADKVVVAEASGTTEYLYLRKIAILGTKGCQTTLAAIPN